MYMYMYMYVYIYIYIYIYRTHIGRDDCGEDVYSWEVGMPEMLPRGHYGVDAETNSFLNVKASLD